VRFDQITFACLALSLCRHFRRPSR
jgi:hypothetical protein